jgi:hypothetical protein
MNFFANVKTATATATAATTTTTAATKKNFFDIADRDWLTST